MQRNYLLLKISFVLLLLVAGLHTFFILIGGPTFPNTSEFNQMQESMRTISFDIGAHIFRTMQNVMDGFNFIVAIFLFTLPILSWLMLSEIKGNEQAVKKLTWVNLIAVLAFSLTSFAFLAIGGTVVGGLVCLLLIASLTMRR